MLGLTAVFSISTTLKSLGKLRYCPPAKFHFARPHLSASTRCEDATAVQKHLWATRDLFSTDIHGIVRCGPQLAPPRFRLAYIPCRNRGEILRLILEESGAEYELEVVGFKNWETGVKATTPHGKLPVLRDYDGRGSDLGQEGAITRHLASECGLAGEGAAERAAVDSLYCFWFATLRNQGVSHDGEHFSIAALKTCDQTVADVPTYEEIFRRDELPRAVRSLAALGYFERTLEAAGTGFLVADRPLLCDLGLFYVLYELAEDDNCGPGFAARFGVPLLGAFVERMAARPQIAAYLASPTRMPRYARAASGASTYEYVAGRLNPEIL